ncbi:MAG: epoxyqueuosine reductase QueH [Synergistaceae bacterium]|nr:epoxyqueuosine reductase QueH [Synergistaceae bacterium]
MLYRQDYCGCMFSRH